MGTKSVFVFALRSIPPRFARPPFPLLGAYPMHTLLLVACLLALVRMGARHRRYRRTQ